jgi:hypothetical protein
MALRAAPEPESWMSTDAPEGVVRSKRLSADKSPLNQPPPSWAPMFGATSLTVGVTSIAWALFARPEYGDLSARLDYFLSMFNNDRCTIASLHRPPQDPFCSCIVYFVCF